MQPFKASSLAGLLLILGLNQSLAQKTSSMLTRQSLGRFDLATCADGSTAAYYHDQSTIQADDKVLIYLPHDPITCSDADSCVRKCDRASDTCSAPIETSMTMREGIWSQDKRNNPFADYFKVMIPSCSSDEFSGSRGASAATGGITFHGRHIFSSVLRDLTAKYGLDRAKSVVLVGTGSGARGAARNCDFLADAIASVNTKAQVRCVLDGVDLTPYWVRSPDCNELGDRSEGQKFLWGREDDESCLEDGKDRFNSTELATSCGVFSKYWKHVETPVFITANQLDQETFSESTCGVTSDAEDFSDYTVGWRQGVLALAEALSVDKPANGWFIPNCDAMPGLLDADHADLRRTVTVPLLDGAPPKEGEEPKGVNVLQTINNWLTKGKEHQAIDAFGLPNGACSAQRSLPLDLRPDTFLPEVGQTDQKLRSAPVRAFGDGPINDYGDYDDGFNNRNFAFGPRSRFLPPHDLFSDSAVVANAAPDGRFPIDDFLDYDGFSLGSDFDYGIETGVAPGVGAAVAGHIPVVHAGRRPALAVGRPAVVSTRVRTSYRQHGRPGVLHTQGRRKSLWNRLYYLEYLRNAYRRNYQAYHNEYYGTGVVHAPAVAATATTHHVVRPAVHRGYSNHGHGYRSRTTGYGGYRRSGNGAYFARIQEKKEDGVESEKIQAVEKETLGEGFETPDSQVESIEFEKLTKKE